MAEDDVEDDIEEGVVSGHNMEEEDHLSISAPSEAASLHLSSPAAAPSPSQPGLLPPPALTPAVSPLAPAPPPSPGPGSRFRRPSVIMRCVREVVFDNYTYKDNFFRRRLKYVGPSFSFHFYQSQNCQTLIVGPRQA